MNLSCDVPRGQLTTMQASRDQSESSVIPDSDRVELDQESSACTSATSTTTQSASLLDKLKSPARSDLCRKRKVQTLNKPTATKKRHQAGASNSTDPKGVAAQSRVKEFPGEYLVVKKDKLFCEACREELALKKSTISNHIGSGEKHKKPRRLWRRSRLENRI